MCQNIIDKKSQNFSFVDNILIPRVFFKNVRIEKDSNAIIEGY